MFISITRSITNWAKGPRAILAEKIGEVLAEHFILNPHDIESSLLSNARIVLKNTQLRSKRYKSSDAPNAVISVRGFVEEVVFSWRWSLSGGSGTSSTPVFPSASGCIY